jgi:hypothetical protein
MRERDFVGSIFLLERQRRDADFSTDWPGVST